MAKTPAALTPAAPAPAAPAPTTAPSPAPDKDKSAEERSALALEELLAADKKRTKTAEDEKANAKEKDTPAGSMEALLNKQNDASFEKADEAAKKGYDKSEIAQTLAKPVIGAASYGSKANDMFQKGADELGNTLKSPEKTFAAMSHGANSLASGSVKAGKACAAGMKSIMEGMKGGKENAAETPEVKNPLGQP